MAYSAGLNGFQVEKVNIENNSQSSTQTQLFASELVAACTTLILTSMCAVTLQTFTRYIYTITFSTGQNHLFIIFSK